MQFMQLYKRWTFGMLVVMLFASCDSTPKQQHHKNEQGNADTLQKATVITDTEIDTTIIGEGIQMKAIKNNEALQEYQLELLTAVSEALKPGKQQLEFAVKNGEGDIVESSDLKVGVLLNNQWLTAKPLADLNFELNLLKGNNVVFAYLINEKGMSVKSATAFVLNNFYVGDGESFFNPAQAHLFYLRPNDLMQKKKNPGRILDFYLLNASLNKATYQIKLTINHQVFVLNRWQSFLIEGLNQEEQHLRIQLINKEGEVVFGPFNDSGMRTVRGQY